MALPPFVSTVVVVVVVVVAVLVIDSRSSFSNFLEAAVGIATFFMPVPAVGEAAVFFATPFCCTFRTAGDVAVGLGASEVRLVVDGLLPPAVAAVFVAAGLTSSGFLAASRVLLGFAAVVPVVPVALVVPIRDVALLLVVVELVVFAVFVTPSVVVVPLVVFAATVLLTVLVVVALGGLEGTEVVETELEGREVTVRVVVPVVDRREVALTGVVVPVDDAGLGAAVLVVELALAVFVVLGRAAFVLAAVTDDEVVVVLVVVVAVFAASVADFFAASDGLLAVALAGRASFTPLVEAAAAVGFAVPVVGAFLTAFVGGAALRLAAVAAVLLPTRGAAVVLLTTLSLAAVVVDFVPAPEGAVFLAVEAAAGAFGLAVLLATVAATAAMVAPAAAATTPVAANATVDLSFSAGRSRFSFG